MPKTRYDRRILMDKFFLSWLKKIRESDGQKHHDAAKRLLIIKASSAEHPKDHSIILQTEFDELIGDGTYTVADNLKGIVKPMEKPDFIKVVDGFSTIIRTAIYLANDKPYRTVIFTSPDKLKDYENNPHYTNVSSVDVKAGDVALEEIGRLFKTYEETKAFRY